MNIHRFVIEAIGCEIVHFFESLTGGGIYGIFLLWATWAHEYTSETASNPEGEWFAPLCQSHPGLAVATKPHC